MTVYFGPPWDTPHFEEATQVATPIGDCCGRCDQEIVDGDTGFIYAVAGSTPDREILVIHAECEALSIVGHIFGVCSCTGFPASSRASARELQRRLGVGPLPASTEP